MAAFDADAVDPEACIDNAARFDREAFREGFQREVATALAQEQDRPSEILAARRAAGERPRLAAVRTLARPPDVARYRPAGWTAAADRAQLLALALARAARQRPEGQPRGERERLQPVVAGTGARAQALLHHGAALAGQQLDRLAAELGATSSARGRGAPAPRARTTSRTPCAPARRPSSMSSP